MARKEQTGAGGRALSRSGGRGRGVARRASKRTASRRERSQAKHASTGASHGTWTASGVEHPAAGSAWRAAIVSGVGDGVAPLRALGAGQSSSGVLLTLAGAEHAALREVFQAWNATRDQAANRAWRRPGGLARMAGL
ncbi:MAG TPA: hypothetical protein VFN78_11755 [Ktedonobacterales bacterium]|nr:hypothetical protein [Ktedonobacterales bacterium]